MKRLAILGGLLLLTWLYQAAPASVGAPLTQAVARPAVEILLSSAPSSAGTVVEMSLPAELLKDGDVPIIEKPGMEHRVRGVRP